METLIGLVTDDTPASLEYGDYRGWVEINADTGEWLRNLTPAELVSVNLGPPIYSEEYSHLRPVIGGAL